MENSKPKSITIKLKNHVPPTFTEDKRSDWVKFGKDNDYPDHLVWLFNSVGVHNAIITGKVNFICGGGISVDTNGLSFEDKAALENKTKNINDFEDILAFTKKMVTDGELHNNIAIEVIWSDNGNTKQLYHIDAGKIRVSKEGDRYAYSPDWKKYYRGTKKDIDAGFKEWDAYDPENPRGSQLFYWSDYRPNMEYYGLPEYVGAVSLIEEMWEINNFHYNHIKNGMMAGTIVNFSNDMPSDEQADEIERAFNRKFTGTDNAGATMLNFVQEGSQGATVTRLVPDNLDQTFATRLDDVNQGIFIGHKIVSPMLFGVKTEGQLGGRTELVESFELLDNTYVKPRQSIYEKILNYLLETDRIELNSVDPITEKLSEQTLTQILTTDELRKLAGYAPLADTSQEFNKVNIDDLVLEELSKRGRDAEQFEFLSSRPLKYSAEGVEAEPVFNESEFRSQFQIDGLNDFDREILNYLKDDPKLSAQELADATGSDLDTVDRSLKKLQDLGAFEVNETQVEGETQIERNLTEDAINELEIEPAESDFQVVYRYRTRPDVPRAESGSRDFCRRLLTLNRVYTREEIDQISGLVNRNVWLRRGGWYHNPVSKINTPYCRHYWEQSLIRIR